MNRHFILAYILLMTNVAGADLFLTVNGVDTDSVICHLCDELYIGIGNTEGSDQYNAMVALKGDDGEWTGGSRLNCTLPYGGGWERLAPSEEYGDIWYAWFSQPIANKLLAGIIGEVVYRHTGMACSEIKLFDDYFNVIDTLTICKWSPDMYLTLLAPLGGEYFKAGSSQMIKWDAGLGYEIYIEYSTDNGINWTGVSPPNVGNTGNYNWLVPDIDSEQCLIRISYTSYPFLPDQSGSMFTIFRCTLVGDLNYDCYVNILDLALMAENWLKCGNTISPACGMRYPLTVLIQGGHGEVIPYPSQETYAKGKIVSLEAKPDIDYQVKRWIGTDNDSSTETTNTVTIISDTTVSVEFEPIPHIPPQIGFMVNGQKSPGFISTCDDWNRVGIYADMDYVTQTYGVIPTLMIYADEPAQLYSYRPQVSNCILGIDSGNLGQYCRIEYSGAPNCSQTGFMILVDGLTLVVSEEQAYQLNLILEETGQILDSVTITYLPNSCP
jgi:hypothetical protein